MPAPVPLGSLPAGTRGKVAALNLRGDERARLMEMGLTVGADVTLLRYAPLGDPLEVRIRGYALSLRRSEAEGILIQT